MGLVAAKCTQCGANIKVDDTKDAGICEFCGTPFVTEKVINNYNTYVTNNFAGANINVTGANADNLLKMAANAIEAENGLEALNYVNKALEANPESPRAWILKMKTVKLQDDLHNNQLDTFSINVQETVTYGNKAIEYALSEEKEKVQQDVYIYYLELSEEYLRLVVNKAKDTDSLRQTRQSVIDSKEALNELLNIDMNHMRTLTNIATSAYALKKSIPVEYIKKHKVVQEKLFDVVNLYVKFCCALTERMHIHRSSFNNETLEGQEENVEKFSEGLSDDQKSKIHFDMSTEKENNNMSSKSSGCYIATCVYGSYDCPEVWTLRRFRDYTLDSTWYGKLFIKCYYAISPTLVKLFGNTTWFKKFWKEHLDKMVMSLKEKGVQDTFYQDKY